MQDIYLQMYSFGDFEPGNNISNLKKAAQMGYCGVELFGPNFILPAEEMKGVLHETGLKAISLHADTDKIIDMIPYAKELGLQYMGIGMQYLPDYEAVCKFAGKLNQIGEECNKNGIMLTYHNHTQEFAEAFDEAKEKTYLAHIAEKTNPEYVGLELDAGWCAAAGYDPIEFIKEQPGRVKLVHIKESEKVIGVRPAMNPADMKVDESGHPVFTKEQMAQMKHDQEINCPAGKGIVNWEKLIPAARANGCEAFIVEREYTYGKERDDCLKEDIAYYKSLEV